MGLISELRTKAIDEGYNGSYIDAKVCQDIILMAISKSSFRRRITVKGGVVMRSITNDTRRATQDIDLDFIKYSISEKAIEEFVETINCIDEVAITRVGEIKQLHQQDYDGKRIYIEIKDDEGTKVISKLDLGVHKYLDIKQEEYCFDVGIDDEGVNLLINSFAQMFTEKLKSLLRFGTFSTRYKDVFDLYYLKDKLSRKELMNCFKTFIYDDERIKENSISDISERLNELLKDKVYIDSLNTSKSNWLGLESEKVLKDIIQFLSDMKK